MKTDQVLHLDQPICTLAAQPVIHMFWGVGGFHCHRHQLPSQMQINEEVQIRNSEFNAVAQVGLEVSHHSSQIMHMVKISFRPKNISMKQ